MSHLQNFLRDMVHARPGQAVAGFPAAAAVSSTCPMNSSGVVNQTAGSQHNPYFTQGNIGWNLWHASGVLMSQPVVDDTPYRVKAYVAGVATRIHIIVGYAPAAPTGVNDAITNVVPYPAAEYSDVGREGVFDEVILMPGLQSGHPDFGKPIAFGVAISTLATSHVAFNISVQNLAKTAPKYASSMS